MLSIIVEYYFCVGSTHKPVITPTLSAPRVQKCKKKFSWTPIIKPMSEILDIRRKCQIRLKFLQGAVYGKHA